MPENAKTGREEENFSLYFVKNGPKDGIKNPGTFQETPVECSNDSEKSREERAFLEWPEESREPNSNFSDEKISLILSATSGMFGS